MIQILKSVIKDDLKYWLSRPSQERIEAVEILRRQFHGNPVGNVGDDHRFDRD